jgi:hypothetical protein
MRNRTPKSLALVIWSLLAAGLCGCGGGSVDSGPRFSPPDGAKSVDIRPTLQVSFGSALDASLVTADHVHLTTTGFNVLASIAYDDTTHTITVTPTALRHDTRYTLSLVGLTDDAGHAIPDASTSFSTWINALVDQDQVVQINDFPTHFVTTLDADGHPSRTTGTDPFGTVKDCATYVYRQGRLMSKTDSAPGSDGQCFTADDQASYTDMYVYDDNGALAQINHLSGDAASRTLDYDSFEYDALGDVTRDTTTWAGADGLPNTADDTFAGGQVSVYDDQGRLIHTVENAGNGPGPDEQPLTNDDIGAALVFTPGGQGTPDATIMYKDAGADGVWLTGDDSAFTYSYDTRDARGNIIQTRGGIYGFDSIPTEDLSCVRYTYDAHDNLVKSELDDVGADGIACTADDGVVGTLTYDTAH